MGSSGRPTDAPWSSSLSSRGFLDSWSSFPEPSSGHLQLDALDFSDLWDDEDLGLDSPEADRTNCTPDGPAGLGQAPTIIIIISNATITVIVTSITNFSI